MYFCCGRGLLWKNGIGFSRRCWYEGAGHDRCDLQVEKGRSGYIFPGNNEKSLAAGNGSGLKVRVSGGGYFEKARNILIRGTNWIGDAVMTLPALAAVRNTFPQARLAVLAKPWVAEIYRMGPAIDEVVLFQSPGRHAGISGKFKLASELRERGFDAAILLQNAVEAAVIATLAGIPIRAGYDSDARGMLLTHAVRRTPAIRRIHQTEYYLEMVKALGCRSGGWNFPLHPDDTQAERADILLSGLGVDRDERLIGLAPGATYGPAKKWFPERFAAVADRLEGKFGVKTILFGSGGDRDSTALVAGASHRSPLDLAGKTSLNEAIALMARCSLFISNDSGLMHVAGALGIPTLAIFGSTNPVTTSPVGVRSVVIHKDVDCSPCLKKECPTDFRCMDLIRIEEVYEVAASVLSGKGGPIEAMP